MATSYVTGFGKTLRKGFAHCAILVALVEICQSPDFVTYLTTLFLTVAVVYRG